MWSAYGFGLYLIAQVIPVCLGLYRGGSPVNGAAPRMAAVAFSVLLGCLFLLAGKSLASTGGARGSALPWVAVSALVTVPFVFLEPFVIPTGAMENTLLIGDHILVQRFPRPKVARDDLIVHIYPVDRRQTFVKRVVGIPGDHIRFSHKVLYRNGTPVQEPFAVHTTEYEDPYRDDFPAEPKNIPLAGPGMEMLARNVVNGEVVVPEGSYFVLGDNRDNSLDSRYWGFVKDDDVIGKPLLIYDSQQMAAGAPLDDQSLRWYKVRWARLFKLL